MNNKEKWEEFVSSNSEKVCIYAKPWWLDLMVKIGGGYWDVALSEKDNSITGALPYYVHSKYGMRYISQPFLTQHCGLYLPTDDSWKSEKRYKHQQDILSELISSIESKEKSLVFYKQNLPHYCFNGLSYYWRGYRLETRYTYVIHSSTIKIDEIEKAYSKVIRYDIKKAKSACEIVEENDVERFYSVYEQTFKRQNMLPPVSLSQLKMIDSVLDDHAARRIVFARSEEGYDYNAAYFVFDDKYMYYLLSGSDIKYRDKNALCLLIHDAINYACDTNRDFDFEGSMTENINDYFRKFGAIQSPYLNVTMIMAKNKVLKSILGMKFS